MTYMTNKGGWEKYHPTTPHADHPKGVKTDFIITLVW